MAETTTGYIKAEELASLLDLSVQRVGQLRKKGVLKSYKLPEGTRYKAVESVHDYIHFLRDHEEKIKKPITEEKLHAEIRFKNAKAKRAELETAELEGKMHRAEDVEALWNDRNFAIRGALMALPGRIAVDANRAGSPAEASEVIKKEVYRILKELASYEYNPESFAERVEERVKMEMNWKRFKDGDEEAMSEYFDSEGNT